MKNKNTQSRAGSLVSTSYVIVLLCSVLLSIPPIVALICNTHFSLGFRISSPLLSTVIALLIIAVYALAFGLSITKKTNVIWLAFLALGLLYLLEFVEPVLDRLAILIYEQTSMHAVTDLFTKEINFGTLAGIFEIVFAVFTYALSASTPLWCALGFFTLSIITRNAVRNNKPARKKFIFPLLLYIFAILTVTAKAGIYLIAFLSEGGYLAEILPYIIAYIATVLIICALIINTISINELVPVHEPDTLD